MALESKLTNKIKQKTESCLIISYSIIANYFIGYSPEKLITEFINNVENDAKKYGLDIGNYKNGDAEQNYLKLYRDLCEVSSGKIEFSNKYIEQKLHRLMDSFNIITNHVNIKNDISSIQSSLVNKESALSLSCLLKKNNQWHAIPVAYDKQFYAVNNASYVNLGENLLDLKIPLDASDIGDGIIFTKRENK